MAQKKRVHKSKMQIGLDTAAALKWLHKVKKRAKKLRKLLRKGIPKIKVIATECGESAETQ
jgi:hypothetical protein